MTRIPPAAVLAALLAGSPGAARAQGIDMSHGGPVDITASQGMEWRQQEQEVVARGDARAVRGDVTVTADELVAFYRKKAAAPGGAQPTPASAPGGSLPSASPGGMDTGNNEIYRLEARGRVNIYTPNDHAVADRAVYDIDQAVLLLTGKALKITTPQDVLTARDAMEYWSQKHMAIARGEATVVTNDGRRVYADTLVAYTKPDAPKGSPDVRPGTPPGAPAMQPAATPPKPGAGPLAGGSSKLEKVDAFGNVEIRTQTEVIRGDRGTYVPDTGLARLIGHVHITRGPNQLNGDEALVNMRTGVSTLTRSPGQRVEGLVVPSDAQHGAQGKPGSPDAPPAPGAKPPRTR